MREIKTGDKYLCNSDEWSIFTKGNIYEVEKSLTNSVRLIDDNKNIYQLHKDYLKTDFKDLQQANDIKVNYEIVPNHYDNKQGYDVIDIAKHYSLNFNRGSAVKYLCRAGKKDNEIEDLQKAVNFINREIKYIIENN